MANLSSYNLDVRSEEDKYLDEVIDLQKKNKALDNVVYKMGQLMQTMHMLRKPQVFYDESYKTTLGYQNSFYLPQAQRKVPALYDGHTIVKTHDALSVTNTEETLELAEEEQAFSLPISQPVSVKAPVLSKPVLKKEIPREIPSIGMLKAKNFSIEMLKEHIANIKEKNVVESVQNMHNSNAVTVKVYKLDLPPLSPCIKNNMAAHLDYLKHIQANVDILRKIIKDARELKPLDSNLAYACTFITHIQELLVYVSVTCPSTKHASDKLVAGTPMNKTMKVRFAESNDTSKDNTQKQVQPQEKQTTNNSMSPSTGVSSSTEASGSKPRCSKHMIGHRSQLMNFVSKFLGIVRFGNDQVAKIMAYGDYHQGNVIISRVYYVEGLRHYLFSVGQFFDADLEVAVWKNTCFIRNLEGVDLLLGSQDINLYIISLDDMLKTSWICLLSKALKTNSWLWHHRLSHLNFGTLNKLAKDGLA
nr:integrase, catalytic region, zinc finger, CCHC-type, peptidase aspartic, catalytic [Tanacetum cinerariifolium]